MRLHPAHSPVPNPPMIRPQVSLPTLAALVGIGALLALSLGVSPALAQTTDNAFPTPIETE